MTELLKEEYAEPACLLCGDKPYRIPTDRVIEKLDAYLGQNDYSAAERHLDYWLKDAVNGGDLRGELTLREEQMGLYRKLRRKNEAFKAAEAALLLLSVLELDGSLAAATVRMNAATVFGAFGENERAEELFFQARAGYETLLPSGDPRLAGLYNNMALTETALGHYAEARALYGMALSASAPGCAPEQAISLLNLADLVAAEQGLEAGDAEIGSLLEKAEALLEASPDDPHCAFVFEKCAPTFSYYGWFAFAETLKKRAEKIYREEGEK